MPIQKPIIQPRPSQTVVTSLKLRLVGSNMWREMNHPSQAKMMPPINAVTMLWRRAKPPPSGFADVTLCSIVVVTIPS